MSLVREVVERLRCRRDTLRLPALSGKRPRFPDSCDFRRYSKGRSLPNGAETT